MADRLIEEHPRDLTRDPREDEDWFRRMPAAAQEELRERWRVYHMRYEPRFARSAKWRTRCLLEGLGTLVLATLPTGIGRPTLLAVPLGLATGWLWWRFHTGRLSSGAVSMAAVVAANVIGGLWSARTDVTGFYLTAFQGLFAGLIGAALGLRRELAEREMV